MSGCGYRNSLVAETAHTLKGQRLPCGGLSITFVPRDGPRLFWACSFPGRNPVHEVSIVPRGSAALGVTIQTPLEDRYLVTEGELLDRIALALGDRAAEEIIFGGTSAGSAALLRGHCEAD